MSISDRVIVLHQGRKLFEGTPAQVRGAARCARPILGPSMALLEIDDLYARYRYAPVLRVSVSVDAGEIVSIFGRNGAGKTTLLKTAMGWLVRLRHDRFNGGRSPGSRPIASSGAASPSFPRIAASSPG